LADDFGSQRNIVRLYLAGPATRPKIAEMVMSPPIDPAAYATVLALLAAIGIVTVAVGETQGSVAERVLDAGRRECAALRERGTPSADIDLALRSFGFVIDLPVQQTPQMPAEGGGAVALARPQILELCLGAMANETALLISDGVVRDPALVDLLLVEGHGFPRHEGGVAFWARHQARSELDAVMQRLAESGGERFRAGQIERLLAEVTPV
jgi:3-hydroxyacyl-CoA dehydrogenase